MNEINQPQNFPLFQRTGTSVNLNESQFIEKDKILLSPLCAIILILIPIILLYLPRKIYFEQELILVAAVILFSIIKIVYLLTKGQKRLISMTFWIFVYIFLGISPFIQIATRKFPKPDSYSNESIFSAFIIILLGLLFFEIGSHLISSIFFRKYLFKQHIFRRALDHKYVFIFSLLALIITSLIVFILGIKYLFVSRYEFFLQLKELAGGIGQERFQIYKTLLKVPSFVSFYTLLVLFIYKKQSSLKINFWHSTFLVAMFILTFLINNPIVSSRYWFGTIVLSTLFLYSFSKSYHFYYGMCVGLILSLLLIFPFADIFRYSINLNYVKQIGLETIIENINEKGDFDGFQQIINTVEYVKDHGFCYGKQFIGTLLFWIPRAIWIDKPIPTGELIALYRGYEYTNLSLPLWGELYLDGGIILVIVFFSLYGFVINEFEVFYLQSKKSYPTLTSSLIPIFAAYQIYFLRGTLMSAFAYFIPIFLFLFICTKKM